MFLTDICIFLDETIRCICTTRICQEMAEPVCTTSGLCYSQYLDRRDGTNPVTKGCVKYINVSVYANVGSKSDW